MKRAHILVVVALLALSCAQVREPSGGEKDNRPPQLIDASPANASVNFTGDGIVLRFDERIKLDRSADKLLISPPLHEKPDVKQLGADAVAIRFNAPLEANTTYLFNVGDAVADLTENNTADLVYVLATGAHIDSLALQGSVSNAFTAKPEQGVLVLAYAAGNDSGFFTGAPDWFARTGADGRFALGYMRPGTCSLFALRDQNGNYRYDLPNEEIAFLHETVQAGTEIPVHLRLFRENAAMQQLVSARANADGALRLVLARPAESIRLRALNWTGGSLDWSQETGVNGDTILLWPSDTTLLNGRAFEVADGGSVLDTIVYERTERMPFMLAVTNAQRVEGDSARTVLFTSRPVAHIDTARIGFDMRPTGLRRIDLPTRPPIEGDVLTLPPGTITDPYGGTHDTLRIILRGSTVKETGRLVITLKRPERTAPRALLQLLSAQDQVVREEVIAPATTKVVWELIAPGGYALKLIEDTDGDGRWTTGALREGRLPERTIRFADPVNVRAGWDVEVSWGTDL